MGRRRRVTSGSNEGRARSGGVVTFLDCVSYTHPFQERARCSPDLSTRRAVPAKSSNKRGRSGLAGFWVGYRTQNLPPRRDRSFTPWVLATTWMENSHASHFSTQWKLLPLCGNKSQRIEAPPYCRCSPARAAPCELTAILAAKSRGSPGSNAGATATQQSRPACAGPAQAARTPRPLGGRGPPASSPRARSRAPA